jgi:hypothetical protein
MAEETGDLSRADVGGLTGLSSVRRRFGWGGVIEVAWDDSFLTTGPCGGGRFAGAFVRTVPARFATVVGFDEPFVREAGDIALAGGSGLRYTVLPSTAPRIASRPSNHFQMNFHTVEFVLMSPNSSRIASRRAWMSPSRSRLFLVSEYIDMRTVTATISTGAKV